MVDSHHHVLRGVHVLLPNDSSQLIKSQCEPNNALLCADVPMDMEFQSHFSLQNVSSLYTAFPRINIALQIVAAALDKSEYGASD